MWEGLGDWTELQHFDPLSYGHNSVSFPFSWAVQPGLSLPHLISNSSGLQLTDFLSSLGLYNNLTLTLLPASVTISHSFNPSTVKVISRYFSTGSTCYLHRCISYVDCLAGVNMLQGDLGSMPGRIIPKIKKMVLDASLLNSQYYKSSTKGKREKSRDRSCALPYTLV